MFVRLATHQFHRTPAGAFGAPAAYEAAMVEDKLQQPEPDPAAVEMAAIGHADANPRVQVLHHRATVWRALHGVGAGGTDAMKLAARAGKQSAPALPECVRRSGLAMQHTGRAYKFECHVVSARNGVETVVHHAGEREKIVALVLQRTPQYANAWRVLRFTLQQFGDDEVERTSTPASTGCGP